MNGVVEISLEKKKVLCVEDHKDTCDLLAFLLSEYELIFAETIEKSLEIFEKEEVDLCILDNWLVDGSGIELCKKIREIDSVVPIVFTSGVAQKDEIEKALSAGAQSYLIKPYLPKELQQVVKELIEKDFSK